MATAFELVVDDPRSALAGARALADDPDVGELVSCSALWVIGLGLIELGQTEEARSVLAESAAQARRLNATELEAHVRMTLSNALYAMGEGASALSELQKARRNLGEGERARVDMQIGLLALQDGRLEEAQSALDGAISILRRRGEHDYEAKALASRGALHTLRGRWRSAEADFSRLRRLAEEADHRMLRAASLHNLGVLAGRRGEMAGAIALLEQARQAYAAIGSPARLVAALDADEAEVLLGAGLIGEARERLEWVIDGNRAAENRAGEAEALLLASRACRLDDDFPQAAELARLAADLFAACDRPAWAERARLEAATSAMESPGSPRPSPAGAARLAVELDRHGWTAAADEARRLVARIHLDAGSPKAAGAALAGTSTPARVASAEARAAFWALSARLRLARGDRGGARRALVTGFGVLQRRYETVGSLELRASMIAAGRELTEQGMRLAAGDDDVAGLLVWSERYRAAGANAVPVRAPADQDLADALADLRQARSVLFSTAEGADPAPARSAVARAERRVSALVRARPGPGIGRARVAVGRELVSAAGDAVVVAFVSLDGELVRILATADGMRWDRVGAMDGVSREVDALVSASERLIRGAGSRAAREAAMTSADVSAARLDHWLLGGIPSLGDANPVVVVPTGNLHDLPWAWLPTLAARPIVVSPSVTAWLRAGASPRNPRSEVLVACGPGIDGGERELAAIAGHYERCTVLAGSDATSGKVLAGLARSGIAHIAAHGHFRWRAPLFSALELADGALTVHDLELIDSVPTTVVLPACDAGRSTVRPGDGLLGTTAALLSLGVASVVAPVTPVASQATAGLMDSFHAALAGGSTPAAALAVAVDGVDRSDPLSWASARSFGCFGS